MYGMVNAALESMIVEAYGTGAWERIRRRAGVDTEVFVTNESYPDDTTYQLLNAAGEIIGKTVNELLTLFGVHWALKTADQGYGELMAASGRTFREFMLHLPSLHTRVGLIFPNLQPPEFQCTEVRDGAILLHYRSGREGLGPMVTGLILGLGERFRVQVKVTLMPPATGCELFLVEWIERQISPKG